MTIHLGRLIENLSNQGRSPIDSSLIAQPPQQRLGNALIGKTNQLDAACGRCNCLRWGRRGASTLRLNGLLRALGWRCHLRQMGRRLPWPRLWFTSHASGRRRGRRGGIAIWQGTWLGRSCIQRLGNGTRLRRPNHRLGDGLRGFAGIHRRIAGRQ
ncbi:MAG: hypothetical protein H6988_12030 [Pseudomonadales bacterium]|nr:hypothetical protein [Pseudomonadales bacterium]